MTASDGIITFVRLRSRDDAARWLVHEDLRPRLVADAEQAGVSLIDQTVAILAEKFDVPYATTQRKTTPAVGGDVLNLTLPVKLHRKIRTATRHPRTIADTVRTTLSAHYELPMPPKHQRVRRT